VLGLRTALPSNWEAGLLGSDVEGAFATPSVGGHVMVVGADLARAALDAPRIEQWLCRLSSEFGRAMWFCADARRDIHGWALAERGELVRGYAYTEEHGHCWWHGELTDVERALDCFVDDPRDQSDDDVKWWPDAVVVRTIARTWAIDPMQLGPEHGVDDIGLLGRI